MEAAPWCRRAPQRLRCAGLPQVIVWWMCIVVIECNMVLFNWWPADANAACPSPDTLTDSCAAKEDTVVPTPIPVPKDLTITIDVLLHDCPMTSDSHCPDGGRLPVPHSWQPLIRDPQVSMTEMSAPFQGPYNPCCRWFLRLSETQVVHSYNNPGF